MAKSKKLSYISVPSQIINSLSSSSLQSLLVSPKKYSKTSFSKRFFSFNWYKSPRFWFCTLFFFGLFGMLKLGFILDPLIPFSSYPCFTRQTQDSFPKGYEKSLLSFASNDGQNGQKDEFLNDNGQSESLIPNGDLKSEEGIESNGQKDSFLEGHRQSKAVMAKGYGESVGESEFWKQPDGMGYKPCLGFSRDYRKQSEAIVKGRRKYLLVVVSGGMNQQRNQIVDAVVIARILGAALVVPILQVNVIWGDERYTKFLILFFIDFLSRRTNRLKIPFFFFFI